MIRLLAILSGVLAVTCIVLAILLRLSAGEVERLNNDLLMREQATALINQRAEHAIAIADQERERGRTLAKEIDLLHAQLDTLSRTRPNFTGRPRPSDAAGLRESILRATRR